MCSWNPTYLLIRYKENKQDELIQREYFHHITNHVSRQNWQIGDANVKPGDCLDVEMSEVQQVLLNSTPKDMLIGFMTYNVKGKGAVQKIAKRKLCCIGGNVNSYSKLLNHLDRLEAIKEHNQLFATVAEVTAEQQLSKEAKKQKRKEQ